MLASLKQLFRKSSLTEVAKDHIASPEGWQLKITGNLPSHWMLLYQEGTKKLEIEITTGGGWLARSYLVC